MTSKIKVDNVNKVSDDSNIIKKCGTTTTIGSGASNPIVIDGSAITIGRCGGTVALASGATQTGFGRTGAVDWQTSIKTGDFTAANGEGYFIDTSSGQITVTLPSSPSAGNIVAFKDYANTFDTNKVTLNRNGSNIEGIAQNFTIETEGQAVTLVFADSTKGWLPVAQAKTGDLDPPALFTTATGGTITTSGDFKIHTFTGPGTFCVSTLGNGPTNPNGGPNTVSYLVLAGGGGSQNAPAACGAAAGGGAGGFREGRDITPSYTASPLVAPAGLTISASPFPITVGGAGATGGGNQPNTSNNGSNSIFSSITSAGGGTGSGYNQAGGAGGSGGGGSSNGGAGGAGNTPSVSPSQGNNGGNGSPGSPAWAGGGGGGAGGNGGNSPGNTGGPAGSGVTTNITASPVGYAGGGNGRGDSGCGSSQTPFGGASPSADAAANRGGGGTRTRGAGSGVVVIRYKFQ
tara:strand:+ start:1333 stop:2712 length:1380 start_codon:yes stop_codon:yes gene_type:complete